MLLVGGFIFWMTYYPSMLQTGGVATTTLPGTDQTPVVNETPKPAAPVVLTSVNAFPSDTTVVVSGNVTPNGAATSYWYEFGTKETFGSKTANQNVGSGFTVIPAPLYITGLVKDTPYFYRLVAVNQFGTTNGATYSFRTTVGTPAPVGSVPVIKTLAASLILDTTANISGEVTPNKATTQYWFEYGETTTLGNTTALQSVGDGVAKVPASVALTGLNPGTVYQYRVNAQNQFGTVNGAILSFKTSGVSTGVIPVVSTQVGSIIGSTTITMRGTVNPYSTPTMYWFEYSTDANFAASATKTTPQKSAGAGTATVSFETNVSSLKSKTTYYYRTVAQNAVGMVQGTTLTARTN